ncbi:MAG: tetratricopeptide repeat protein [Thermogutta sp.]
MADQEVQQQPEGEAGRIKPGGEETAAPAAGSLLRRWRWIILAGSVSVLATAGVTAYLFLMREPPITAENILEALAAEDYPRAKALAEKAVDSGNVDDAAYRAAMFALGVWHSQEGDRVGGDERSREYALSAAYLTATATGGFPPGWEARGRFLLGRSLHFSNRFSESRNELREAAQLDPEFRPRVLWLLAESFLLGRQPDYEEALRYNEQFLETPSLSVESRNAAYRQRARILLEMRRPADAADALSRMSPEAAQVPESELLRAQVFILEAELLEPLDSPEKQAKYRDLLAKAQNILGGVEKQTLADDAILAQASYLRSRCGELAGDFDDALSGYEKTWIRYGGRPEAWAARFRMAELNRRLGRVEQTVEGLCGVLSGVSDADTFVNRWVSTQEVRNATTAAVRQYLGQGQFAACLRLTETMSPVFAAGEIHAFRAEIHRDWARQLSKQAEGQATGKAEELLQEARRHFRWAGDEYTRLARTRAATKAYPDDLWDAADNYLAGWSFSRASRVLREYLRNEAKRRNSAALLRLGECLLAMGRLDEALLVLNECIEFHAKDAASYEARLLAAHAYQEKADFARAESVLLRNLSGELAPSSREWRASLFALGHLYYEEGKDAEAVPRLEEAVTRYPQDEQAARARYELAEIFRRMALQSLGLSSAAASTADEARLPLRRDAQNRLLAAKAHYETVCRLMNDRANQRQLLHPELILLRNAYFGLGDVCYRLGRFTEALDAYHAVINRFQSRPEVLEAYAQIVRCYQAMGRDQESRIALEQAKIVLQRLPPDTDFAAATVLDGAGWSERFQRLKESL